MIAQPGRRGHHGVWSDGRPLGSARRPGGGAARSVSGRVARRVQAALTWATHPVSRTVLILALLTGGALIGTASWAPGVYAVLAPAAMLCFALGCIVLAASTHEAE